MKIKLTLQKDFQDLAEEYSKISLLLADPKCKQMDEILQLDRSLKFGKTYILSIEEDKE